MDFEFTQRTELRPVPKIVPEQIFAGKILQMPALELESFLRMEFQDNPALLMEEFEPEPVEEPGLDDDWEPSIVVDTDEEYDPFRTVAATATLVDDLVTQFRTQFPPEDWAVGLDIIDSLEENGYFQEDILDAADRHDLSVPEFEIHLRQVQTLDPAGIAARDIRECLLLQAGRRDDTPPVVLRLLEEDAWPLFARRDADKLAALAGVSRGDVEDALYWVRDQLQPYPAQNVRMPWERLAPRKKPLDKPDVIVRLSDGELWVDCPGITGITLGVDAYYERLYSTIRRARGLALDKDARHVVDFVDRARLISHAVDLRAQTLYRIADHVVHYQREMILHGAPFARPYTQKQVAEVIGIHESTVCRATQGKLIQLPQGETVTFDHFFDAAMPVRDMVANLIGREDRTNPLKDGQIAEELERRGMPVARRTVAKYREQLRILPCELRKVR